MLGKSRCKIRLAEYRSFFVRLPTLLSLRTILFFSGAVRCAVPSGVCDVFLRRVFRLAVFRVCERAHFDRKFWLHNLDGDAFGTRG